MRSGLIEFTIVMGRCLVSSRAKSRAWSKLPRSWMTLAPYTIAWASLPIAILPSGTKTTQSMPALAAYAAAAAEVLPVEPQMTVLAPWALALVMAIVMPRSLKEPDGLSPSYLSQTLAPRRSDSRSAKSSGVLPSWRVMISSTPSRSSHCAYSLSSPFQPFTRYLRQLLVCTHRWSRPTSVDSDHRALKLRHGPSPGGSRKQVEPLDRNLIAPWTGWTRCGDRRRPQLGRGRRVRHVRPSSDRRRSISHLRPRSPNDRQR